MNKKLLTLIAFSICSFLFLVNPTNTKAATAGPVGSNGLRAYSGPGKGQVTLEWARVSLTGENYSIHYGTSSGNYIYLADHIGYIANYTISNLVPGQTYYFVLERIWTGNVSVGWEAGAEVSTMAASSVTSPAVTAGPIGRNLLTAKAVGNGKVQLNWNEFFPDTTGWHVVFGTKPGMYQWGALNAVSTTAGVNSYSFTVGLLPRGQRVYFAIAPIRGGSAYYITAEVSVIVQ